MPCGKHYYTVHLSSHTKQRVLVTSPSVARRKVWNDIKDGYTYGWTKARFMKNVRVTRG